MLASLPARLPANLEENRENSALISLVIRARFLKKPQTTSSVLSPSPPGEEEALLGEKTSQREFSRKEGSTRCCSVFLRRKWKASFRVLSPSRCDLDKQAWNSPLKFPTVAWNKAKVRERHGTQCQKTERRLSQGGKFSGGEICLSLSVGARTRTPLSLRTVTSTGI